MPVGKIRCPQCGKVNLKEASYCKHCLNVLKFPASIHFSDKIRLPKTIKPSKKKKAI